MNLKNSYFWAAVKAEKWRLYANGFVLVLEAALVVLLPLPTRFALDHLLTKTDPPPTQVFQVFGTTLQFSNLELLLLVACSLVALGLFNSILEYTDEWIASGTIANFLTRFRLTLAEKILTRQQSYLDRKRKVELLGIVSGDVANLEVLMSAGLTTLVRAIPTLIFALGAMFWFNAAFALGMLVVLPLLYWLTASISKKIRKHAKKMRSKMNLLDQDLLQAMQSTALIKSLTIEQGTLNLLSIKQKDFTESFRKMRKLTGLLNASLSGSRNLLRAALLLVGGWVIYQGAITFGTLFVLISYLESMSRPINEITQFITVFNKTMVSLERVENLAKELDLNPEISGRLPLDRSHFQKNETAMEFDAVSFAYDESRMLLNQFSAQFSNRQLIALVGASGAGKSTFIRLLNRLQEVKLGELRIAGKNIRDYRIEDLRHVVCVSSQEPFLLAMSLRANLEMAVHEKVTSAEIENALRSVNAWDFVQTLPDGLETVIGEGGVQLSGGQAKRISLARAFLRERYAEVFVFDEPTSGLDPVSATLVIQSIERLARQKTLVFWATHRIQEVNHADKVLFFSNTQNPILAHHEELLQSDLAYQTLFESPRSDSKPSVLPVELSV